MICCVLRKKQRGSGGSEEIMIRAAEQQPCRWEKRYLVLCRESSWLSGQKRAIDESRRGEVGPRIRQKGWAKVRRAVPN